MEFPHYCHFNLPGTAQQCLTRELPSFIDSFHKKKEINLFILPEIIMYWSHRCRKSYTDSGSEIISCGSKKELAKNQHKLMVKSLQAFLSVSLAETWALVKLTANKVKQKASLCLGSYSMGPPKAALPSVSLVS